MNNERDFENGDATVSKAYRQTAQEHAPDSLNDAVLQMAAGKKAAGTKGILFAGWVKPVAWAATIGLSLTIVLELTRAPVAVDVVAPSPAAVESVQRDFAPQENRAMEQAKVLERLQAGPDNRESLEESAEVDVSQKRTEAADIAPRDDSAADSAPQEVALADTAPQEFRLAETTPQDDPVTAVTRRSVAVDEPEPAGPEEVAPEDNAAAFAADVSTPGQDQDAARSRVAGLVALAPEKKEQDSNTDCDKDARAQADTWFLCITKLRESGDKAAAEREYAEFLLEHPDPEAHK
ncbi:MAG: hypothetical protein K0U72_05760 [Gammaproteobacteria bacterium]|nr:hypothetical protein [Gammaproteobacteria bacterium]